MPRTQHSKSFSLGSNTERITQTEKMQNQADQYTKKYQWERRNLMTLHGIESDLSKEVQSLKKNVTSLKKESEEGGVKRMFTELRNIQKEINTNDKRYNEVKGDIDNLNREINQLRRQKIMYQNNVKVIEGDIEKADTEITRLINETENNQNQSKNSQNKMLQLKMENEKERVYYYKKLNQLNEEFRDPKFMKGSRIRTGEVRALQNDTATVLKQRLTKLIVNNKEKVKLIDNYQRNMKVIDEAFNTIKEATGLTDIEEIQNTFIKGEEQNYNLLTYVDVLNQQIDTIADTNETLRLQNNSLKIENAEKQRFLVSTPDNEKKRKRIVEYTDKQKEEINSFQAMLDEMQPHLKNLLLQLAGSKFNKQNPYKTQELESSGVPLNESNLEQYLSELEQYTNQVLIERGKSMNQSNSELYAKTLLLEELSAKEFKRRIYDNTPLYNVLDETKEKTRGYERLLDRDNLQDMAKKDLDRTKLTEGKTKKK